MPDLLSFTSNSVQTQVGNSAVLRGQGNQGAVCQASLGEYTQPTEGQRAREFFPPSNWWKLYYKGAVFLQLLSCAQEFLDLANSVAK